MRKLFHWGGQPALAGGIDQDGSQADVLLSAGFAAVEFGTVAPHLPGAHPAAATMLSQRLAAARARLDPAAHIGVAIGMCPSARAGALATDWLNGLWASWPAADYLCFDLSAAAYRPLLADQHLALLWRTLAQVARTRQQLALLADRPIGLALKLPLTEPGAATLAAIAASERFDALIAVLGDEPGRFERLHALQQQLRDGPALIAAGGIRDAAGVRTALAAGAHGVQVRRAFVEQGRACLAQLQDATAGSSR